MKKFLTIIVLATIILTSCTTKVDLYCYTGDTTILYSVLDTEVDTNYFRITKSSLEGNYTYNYDEIDVRFAGLFKNEPQPDTILLDTITLMTDGFPKTYYYTTKKLVENQEYTVMVLRKADSVLVTSKAKTICKISIIRPTANFGINFQSNNVNQIQWVGTGHDNAPDINAGFFSVTGYFHYRELMPGAVDTVDRYMGQSSTGREYEESVLYFFLREFVFEIVFCPESLNDRYLSGSCIISLILLISQPQHHFLSL